MDARTFVSQKYDAAVEELKSLEAEYVLRRDAAQAAIELAQRWLAELGGDKSEVQVEVQPITIRNRENWVSAPNLTEQARSRF